MHQLMREKEKNQMISRPVSTEREKDESRFPLHSGQVFPIWYVSNLARKLSLLVVFMVCARSLKIPGKRLFFSFPTTNL